jgi:23S rRNA (guanosine2251-2'-O)-methyltransferase
VSPARRGASGGAPKRAGRGGAKGSSGAKGSGSGGAKGSGSAKGKGSTSGGRSGGPPAPARRGGSGAGRTAGGGPRTGGGPRGARGSGGGSRRPGAAARRELGGDQVEGRQAVRELLLAGRRRVREVWVLAEQEPSEVLDDIVALAEAERVPVKPVGRSKFFAEARCEAPQGVLAKAAPLEEALLDDLAQVRPGGPPPFLVAVDGVTDPGNLGALLRSAECAGATGVVLPRHRAVHITPTVTKSAAGAVEHLPFTIVGGLPTALSALRDLGVWVVGLDGDGDQELWSLPAADGPICLVLGAEGSGLSRLARQRCDAVVRIPLQGSLASLNVAAAGALACFEVARARA